MDNTYIITHYYHSGFSVSDSRELLVFDYWRGEENELNSSNELNVEQLSSFSHVYVFISHEHVDHMDPVVFTWKDFCNVTYIVSSDMPVGTRGKRMAPGDTIDLSDHIHVTAYDSTDLGVSFLVRFHDISFFHAGDLNFWHWREESTMQEIDEAEEECRKAVLPVSREQIDVAFFPLDPRQGSLFEAGANYFILSVKPRIFIPMHYFHRVDVAEEYARTASNRSTEVIALTGYGETIQLQKDNDGYLNISRHYIWNPANTDPSRFSENHLSDASENTDLLHESADGSEDDPFSESDLPVSISGQDQENPIDTGIQ